MFARQAIILALAGFSHFAWSTADGQEGDRPLDRFKAEYPGAAKRLSDAYSHVSAVVTFGSKQVQGGTNPGKFPRSEYLI